jgi:excisionase family DNA binding protein
MVERLGWSIEEAAERLGIGRSVMCELIQSGEIQSLKIRARRIVPDNALRQYMADLITAQRNGAVIG